MTGLEFIIVLFALVLLAGGLALVVDGTIRLFRERKQRPVSRCPNSGGLTFERRILRGKLLKTQAS